LEQIVALKFLGFPLKHIGELLHQDRRGISDILQSQRQALEEKRRRLDRAIAAIREAEAAMQLSQYPDTAALKKIIEVIEMQNDTDSLLKYYSDTAQAKLAERRQQWTPELQEQATKAWTELFRDVEASLEEDPGSEKAQTLVARWKALVEAFTRGDPDVTSGLGKAWADRQHWPDSLQEKTAPFSNRKVWEFIGKAMNCRQLQGL
jgi:DNA-binding transcriptional MerR regulator